MGEELGALRPWQVKTPKKCANQALSSKELAEQYFDLQSLRQYVEMAEIGLATKRKSQNPNRLRRTLS